MVAEAKKTGRKRGNAEGTIRKREDRDLWEARITGAGGKRRSIYGKTRKEVADKMAMALRDAHHGLPVPDDRLTLGAFLKDWLASKRDLRGSTLERYELDVRRITAAIGRYKLREVTPRIIQTYLDSLAATGRSATTVKHCRAVLRSALNQAEAWDMIARNPAGGRRVSIAKGTKFEAPVITPEDARIIIKAFAGQYPLDALVEVALNTGLRMGELLGLRWTDLDLERGSVTVRQKLERKCSARAPVFTAPKSEKGKRTIPLTDECTSLFRRHRLRQNEARLAARGDWSDYGLVFASLAGTPMIPSNVARRFNRGLQRAGLIHIRPHDLRHGTASLLLAQGVDLKTISDILGHSSIGITADTYAHVTPKLKADAATKMRVALYGTA